MKHPAIRELYDYWNTQRGDRPAPERGDIDPGEIRGLLADTFIVALDESAGHPFRIAGTRVCALFGRDLKQEAFLSLWAPESRILVGGLLDVVSDESVGLLAGVTGRRHAGAALDLELLALPLVHEGRTGARVLGALAPAEVPVWAGASALRSLVLGTFRYVGPAVVPNIVRPRLPVRPQLLSCQQGRLRHGLVVHDGGLADAEIVPHRDG